VTLDPNMNLKSFINDKCKTCNFHLRNIRGIRRFLSKKSCEQLIYSLVTSKLHYGNGVLANLPRTTVLPLQRVQIHGAKIVLQRDLEDSSTKARRDLHWLPVEERVKFKTLCLVQQCIHGMAPDYLCKMFIKVDPKPYNLRSTTNSYELQVPRTKCKTFGDRAFGVNALPSDLQMVDDFLLFKKALKTHLFKESYF
jgi:hypothetical protein